MTKQEILQILEIKKFHNPHLTDQTHKPEDFYVLVNGYSELYELYKINHMPHELRLYVSCSNRRGWIDSSEVKYIFYGLKEYNEFILKELEND